MIQKCIGISISLALFVLAAPAHAQFDWGGSCSAGSGEFIQDVGAWEHATLGVIPAGQTDVRVELSSAYDVDVVLVDVDTGEVIVGWPTGVLRAGGDGCAIRAGVTLCYSGYNGDQTAGGAGNEWIQATGTTTHALEMQVYGFVGGRAQVNYTWAADEDCSDSGEGAFTQTLAQSELAYVGQIPAGQRDVVIELTAAAGADLDIVVRDGSTSLVEWPTGLLHAAGPSVAAYEGMTLSYSGYEGVDGDWGHERIEIDVLTRPLDLFAFGFQAGEAFVTYSWGDDTDVVCPDEPCDGPVDPAGAFFDGFAGPALSDRWRVVGGELVERTFAGGWLSIRPTQYSVWFHELTGPALLTEAHGDFRITTRVRARDAASPLWPVDSFYQFAGLLARDPAGEFGGAPENWVFSVVGYRGEYNAIERKSTVNDLSLLDETRWFGGDAELRICRSGASFLVLQRAVGATEWSLGSRYERPDMPALLEVGVAAYSYTVSPSLLGQFDFFDLTPIGSESECWLD